ncbi:MAG: glycosyl hydrolase family 28 protein, partial [Candidatus Cryptobacteroides sp.]
MKLLLTFLLASFVLDMTPFKDYSYAIVDKEVPYTVTIDCGSAPAEYEVSPHSKGVVPSAEGSKVSFTITEYGQYQLLADGKRYFVFADAPSAKVSGRSVLSFKKIDKSGKSDITAALQKAINETASNGEILVFPEGTYLCRQLTLPSGTHLHLEKGAVLKANPSNWEDFGPKDNVKSKRFINIKDASGVKVTGSGAINGSGRELREQYGDEARIRLVMAIASSDILFEGVMLQDPGSWNTQLLRCENVTYRNVKLMNDYSISNTDGFDPDASKNILFENSFAMCSDDNVAIKTTGYSGYGGELHNVTVRG